MGSLIEILNSISVDTNKEEREGKKKTSFWASETEQMAFDIYHKWIGTESTNPMDGETLAMLSMRKMMEEATVAVCKKAGILIEELTNDERVYFEWGPNKVPISGYPDIGVMIDNDKAIVEVKTYYGTHNHMEVSSGKVKSAYLKQLAIYQYHFKIKHGILLMINQGTGERFEYDLYQQENDPYLFICPDNELEINLLDVFKRFEKIYTENILPNIEPEPEFLYKYDVYKLDWDKVSAADISKARNGKKVLGDWQVKYSSYKDLIIAKQKTTPGYTKEEMEYIRKVTSGYSKKNTPSVTFTPPTNKIIINPIEVK